MCMFCKLCLVADTFMNSIQLRLQSSVSISIMSWVFATVALYIFRTFFQGNSAVCDAYCKFFILCFLTCNYVVVHIHYCFWVWGLLPSECHVYDDECKILNFRMPVAVVNCRIGWNIEVLRKKSGKLIWISRFESQAQNHPRWIAESTGFKRRLCRSWILDSLWSVFGRNKKLHHWLHTYDRVLKRKRTSVCDTVSLRFWICVYTTSDCRMYTLNMLIGVTNSYRLAQHWL